MNYQYPFDLDWSTEEIVDVIKFFECVEKAYESKVEQEVILSAYRRFKEIVPGKADEKKVTDEFAENSGYSTYAVMKKVKHATAGDSISMGK